MNQCPCGSGRDIDECCRPVIRGERSATTVEEMMRSRYSAFVLGEVDWIMESHHPETVDEVDRHDIEHWSRDSEWLGMTVIDTEDGGEDDDEGSIRFRARYRMQGHEVNHVEHARFERVDGEWRFHSVIDDDAPELVPVTPAATVGRNDPCPCGSGSKYKRCCGRAA